MSEKTLIAERVKICFKCHEFIALFPDLETSLIQEAKFNNKHHGHMIQIVNIREMDLGLYKVFE